jgi:hypothetical protein
MSNEPLELSPEHDQFHAPTSDDPWWQETTWFTLMVPERNLYCYVYPWVKANQGILGGGVMVWDDRGRHPWDALHWDYQWTYPYPELGDLRDITFPTGISIKNLEPLTKYRISYEHPDCSFDIVFDAILPAHLLGQNDDKSGTFAGHLDQQGHVTGTFTVGGETFAVDCYAMRDRSWGRRVPAPGLHIGYDLSAAKDSAFIVFSSPDAPGSPVVEGFGYLWHDGEQVPLAKGSRVIERDGVWPSRIIVDTVDGKGRHLEAVATTLNWMGFQNLPSMMNLVSLVRWDYTVDGGDARVAYGEIEDVWDVNLYRKFARETH